MSVKHEHEHDDHITSRLHQPQQWVRALSQSHLGLCGTPVGPGKDTHGTLGPVRGKAVGGPTNASRDTTAQDHKTGLESIVFAETSAVILSS